MHLQGQLFLSIDDLDKQRKTRSVENLSKNFLSVSHPQFVQSSSAQRPAGYNTLRFQTIDHFPRFADALLRRKLFLKFRFEAPSTPHALHENWFEGKWSSEDRRRHDRGKRPTCDVQRPTLNSQFTIGHIACVILDVQYWIFDVRRFRADL